jgi:queuine tRNA-ribosyltransferase
MEPIFTLIGKDPSCAARRGRLRTRHGLVDTPIFMPVGTQATVKALTPAQIRETGARIILGNTYHLNLRPGSELIRDLGGLHRFMAWDGPILTDSGGFQVFSLAKLRRMHEDGIEFQSHLDGARCFLGPREVMGIQSNLGSDIAMVIDECPPHGAPESEVAAAVARSARWARACLGEAQTSGFLERGHHVFAIVQGGMYEHLRKGAAEDLAALEFPGFAIGGVSVGEPEADMLQQVGWVAPGLPAGKPRYVMGVGTPPQLLRMVALGVDMFDCVLPTRVARNGAAFTPDGMINLRNERHRRDPSPIMQADNYTCRHFSRAYLRHLVMAEEILACTLLSLHNVWFFLDLMAQVRAHIEAGDFVAWSEAWMARYEAGGKV